MPTNDAILCRACKDPVAPLSSATCIQLGGCRNHTIISLKELKHNKITRPPGSDWHKSKLGEMRCCTCNEDLGNITSGIRVATFRRKEVGLLKHSALLFPLEQDGKIDHVRLKAARIRDAVGIGVPYANLSNGIVCDANLSLETINFGDVADFGDVAEAYRDRVCTHLQQRGNPVPLTELGATIPRCSTLKKKSMSFIFGGDERFMLNGPPGKEMLSLQGQHLRPKTTLPDREESAPSSKKVMKRSIQSPVPLRFIDTTVNTVFRDKNNQLAGYCSQDGEGKVFFFFGASVQSAGMELAVGDKLTKVQLGTGKDGRPKVIRADLHFPRTEPARFRKYLKRLQEVLVNAAEQDLAIQCLCQRDVCVNVWNAVSKLWSENKIQTSAILGVVEALLASVRRGGRGKAAREAIATVLSSSITKPASKLEYLVSTHEEQSIGDREQAVAVYPKHGASRKGCI